MHVGSKGVRVDRSSRALSLLSSRLLRSDLKSSHYLMDLVQCSTQVRAWIDVVRDTPEELRKVQILAAFMRWGRNILDFAVTKLHSQTAGARRACCIGA